MEDKGYFRTKTINGPSWQFSATSFLDIKFDGDRQVIQGEKKLSNPNLICVFVFLKPDGNDEFFILTMKDLQKHFLKNYKGGVRPRNPKSTHCAVWPKELMKYRDNWELITRHFNVIK